MKKTDSTSGDHERPWGILFGPGRSGRKRGFSVWGRRRRFLPESAWRARPGLLVLVAILALLFFLPLDRWPLTRPIAAGFGLPAAPSPLKLEGDEEAPRVAAAPESETVPRRLDLPFHELPYVMPPEPEPNFERFLPSPRAVHQGPEVVVQDPELIRHEPELYVQDPEFVQDPELIVQDPELIRHDPEVVVAEAPWPAVPVAAVPPRPVAEALMPIPVEPPVRRRPPHETQPGDSLMIRNVRIDLFSLFLSGWFLGLTSSQAWGADAPGAVADRFLKTERQLEELKLEVAKVKEILEALQTNHLQPSVVQIQKNAKEIDDLKFQLSQIGTLKQDLEKLLALEKTINDMRRELKDELAKVQSADKPRLSLSPPTSPSPSTQVELINMWSSPVSVVVDDLSYSLKPGEKRFIPKSAGKFSYEILGIKDKQERTLASGHTFTITIGPR
jgi:hypothetical protein